MKILRKVVVTSVFVIPMILSAQVVVQGMGIRKIKIESRVYHYFYYL